SEEKSLGLAVKSSDRLQGDFGGEFGTEAETGEPRHLSPDLAVLGQVATRLPHHPDRRNPVRLPCQGRKQRGGTLGVHGSTLLSKRSLRFFLLSLLGGGQDS